MDNLNVSINASNQANLSGRSSSEALQMNMIIVMVWPYEIEKLEFEELNMDISVDERGNFRINGKVFKTISIEPGVRVLGISKSIPE